MPEIRFSRKARPLGRVLAPMGSPNAVLFHARRPGQAAIDVVTGDPWGSPATRRLTVVVEPRLGRVSQLERTVVNARTSRGAQAPPVQRRI